MDRYSAEQIGNTTVSENLQQAMRTNFISEISKKEGVDSLHKALSEIRKFNF